MEKSKVARIVVADASKNGLDFNIDIKVTGGGIFYAALPKDIRILFTEAGVSFDTKGRRNPNPGFFSDSTYEALFGQIEDIAKEYVSCRLTSKKIVIQYVLETACTYLISDAEQIVPSGRFVDDFPDRCHFRQGTVLHHATEPRPFGLRAYVKATLREDYSYLSGKTHTRYSEVPDTECANRPNLKWLCGISDMSKPSFRSVQEMDYTEETAEFFVNIIRSICALNEKIRDILDPKSIQQLVENQIKLLP